MRRIEKLPTPGTIAAGQTATFNIPLGPTYHRFYIQMDATNDDDPSAPLNAADWADYVGDIRLIINGDTRIELAAKDLVALNTYHGHVPESGVLPLFLSQPWMRTPAGEDNTAYGTAEGIASFSLELDLADEITVQKLEVRAVITEPQPFGAHLRIQRFNKQLGLQGKLEIPDLPLGNYAMLGLHVTTGQIDAVEILTNNVKVHDTSRALRREHLKIIGKTPQANYTHIDFLGENRLGEALPMALNDFRLSLETTADNLAMSILAVSIQGAA